MTKLSVNVNQVATLRNTRPHIGIPSPAKASALRASTYSGSSSVTSGPTM